MISTKIKNLSTISKNYDAFLIDAWGVLHDGGPAFPKALECLTSLKHNAKKVVILSNAARRTNEFDQELLKSGIDANCYDFSLSSGELVWQNLKHKNSVSFYKKSGKRCFYLGPKRSSGLLNDLDLDIVTNVDNADFILNTGTEGNHPDAIQHKPLLLNAFKKQLPMICANPDLVAIRKGIRGISAGAIAKLYEELGGMVQYTGKPYSQIYQVCYEKLEKIPKSKILMIGDGLQTDIKGANDFRIDSLFIKEGIYHQQIEEQLNKHGFNEESSLNALFIEEDVAPTYHSDYLNY